MQCFTAIGVIPARYNASRLPGKPLADIGGKPMIQHVYERAAHAKTLSGLIVATDDARIFNAVQQFGGRVRMTDAAHPSGSDRVAEVARTTAADYIVNIQGDEPFVSGAVIDAAVEKLHACAVAVASTLVTRFRNLYSFRSANTAKVVLRKDDIALYFSRAPIPYDRDESDLSGWLKKSIYYQQIGLYVFRRDFLLKFVALPIGHLERVEKLEQLRILENGYQIVCAKADTASFCVDTPDDLAAARKLYKESQGGF